MSQTLSIGNFPEINIVEKTKLTADAAAAQAVLAVENNQNFATNNHAIVGRLGAEGSEKITVGSVSGATGVTADASLTLPHYNLDDFTRIFGNKIRIYRAADSSGVQPDDTNFSSIATIDIDFDQVGTKYTDTSGDDTYWYKATFYDSTTDTETPLSNSKARRGGDYGNYATIESIKQKAGLKNNRNIPDTVYEQRRQAAQRLIDAELTGLYTVPFTAPINDLIAEITRLLAAGYVLMSEYGGATGSRFFQEGQAMIDQVTNAADTGLLDRIKTRDLILTDQAGTELDIASASGVSGWPDATTKNASTANGGGEFMFTVEDRY